MGSRHGLQNRAGRHRGANPACTAGRVRLHDGHRALLRSRTELVRGPSRLAPRALVVRAYPGRGVRLGNSRERLYPTGRPGYHPAAGVLSVPPDDPGQRPQDGNQPAALRRRPLHHGLRGLRAAAAEDRGEDVHPVQPPQPRWPCLDRRRAAEDRRHLPAP